MKKRKVLITREAEQSLDFVNKLEHAGYAVHVMPLIKTRLVSGLSEMQDALDRLEKYDWIIFTSANAVRFFFQVVEQFNIKLYYYPNLKIATVGEKTKHYLEQLGYRTNFVPVKFTAEVLAANIGDIEGRKVLIPRSSSAKDDYVTALRKRGADVDAIDLYDTTLIQYSGKEFEQKMGETLDFITFASPSAVKAFHANQTQSTFALTNEKIICIGPSTAKKVEEIGLQVDAIAEPYTIEGMIDAIDKIERND